MVIPRALRALAWALALTLWVPDAAVVAEAYATATQAATSCADATDGGSASLYVEVKRSNEAYPVNRLRNIGLRSGTRRIC